jgi:type II secretory pathway component GspD/PulD (secretin)
MAVLTASLQAAGAAGQARPAGDAATTPTATTPTAITPTSATEVDAKEAKHSPSKRDRAQAAKLFVEGAKDVEEDKIRRAMDSFTRAAELDPEETKYAMADQIARAHLVTELIQQSDKEKILGHPMEARATIAEAYSIDPASPEVAQHLAELASAVVAGEPAMRSDEPGAAPPITLEPKAGTMSFHIRTSKRNVIQQVMQAYGIQTTLDDSVDAQTVRYDVDNADWPAAERTLELATGTFVVPLDPARALVAKDTRANHDKLERLAAETVYMPGLSSAEMTEIANAVKNVFAVRSAVADASSGTLTVRGRAEDVNALNTTLKTLLEGRSEVQLDVRMFEVDRTKAVNLGAILPNQTTLFNVYSEARNILNSNASTVQEIISSGLAAPGDWEAILAILIASGQLSNTILTQPFGIFGGGLTMTGVAYQGGSMNMQLNSSDVRSLDQLQLRVLDHEEATIKAGERYPIETSSYSSLGGTQNLNIPGLSNAGLSSTLQNLGISASQLQAASQVNIPQVEYQDIGLSLVVTPTLEDKQRVSMKFHLTLSALAGSSINSLPVLTNREYNAITSVKLGESALLVSSVTRQESDAITGLPGLSELPGFQSTTNKNSNLDIGELAIVITPHIVRSVNRPASEKMILLPVGQSGPQ